MKDNEETTGDDGKAILSFNKLKDHIVQNHPVKPNDDPEKLYSTFGIFN